MPTSSPPDGPRPELATTAQVSLRSEPDQTSTRKAYLQGGAVVWEAGRQDDWVEVWVHGFVHENYLKAL